MKLEKKKKREFQNEIPPFLFTPMIIIKHSATKNSDNIL